MKVTTGIILLCGLLYGEACVCPMPMTTTATTTSTTTTTTTTSGNRKKRSTDECAELEAFERMAFDACPHGADGFSWQEVKDCESKFENVDLPIEMPTKANFDAIDANGNGDGIMTFDEWRDFVQC